MKYQCPVCQNEEHSNKANYCIICGTKIDKRYLENRKIKLLDGSIQTFMIKGQKNPCGCGSNCFHKEDDGITIYGVCNSCNEDIYAYKEREDFEEYKIKTN